jgi:epoxyqueuosine reductase
VLSKQIRVFALEAGFDLAGVAPLAAWRDLDFAQAWAERGYGGEMAYLRNPKRADPRLILPSARSVVCVGLVYNTAFPYSTEVGCQSSVVSRQLSVAHGESTHDNEPRTTNHERIHARTPNPESQAPSPEPRGWISRYAWGRDYHQVMRSRLEHLRAAIEKLAPGVETRVYVDTGPIVERAFARLSGIGWVGKNTCLINQQKGSWFFLGVILTSLDLEPDAPAFDRCGSCSRCLDACPTGALVEPYVMDASSCIAYLNIELKGSIPAELRPAIGANMFGCDICQDVCPWNRPSSVVRGPLCESGQGGKGRSRPDTTGLLEFQPRAISCLPPVGSPQQTAGARRPTTDNGQLTTDEGQRTTNLEPRTFSLFNPRLEDLASLTEDDFRRIFRDSPIRRAKYRGWLRNLCVVMGNSGNRRFIPWLEQMLREGEDPVVREHAEWALRRLQKAAR